MKCQVLFSGDIRKKYISKCLLLKFYQVERCENTCRVVRIITTWTGYLISQDLQTNSANVNKCYFKENLLWVDNWEIVFVMLMILHFATVECTYL